jgi:hypothetical protein
MLKIIIFSASLLLLPKHKWALINLAVILLTVLSVPILVDKVLTTTPSTYILMDPVSYSLIVLSI